MLWNSRRLSKLLSEYRREPPDYQNGVFVAISVLCADTVLDSGAGIIDGKGTSDPVWIRSICDSAYHRTIPMVLCLPGILPWFPFD